MQNLATQNYTEYSNFIFKNVSLADKNWFKTGGLAHFYCEPKTAEDFKFALKFAHFEQLKIFVLGQGANILISDEGFRGLVIRPQINSIMKIQLDDNYDLIEVGSGVVFQDLINWCLENQLIGLEEFSGIPGTVGGSVFINIHYFEFLLSQFLVAAQIINNKTGQISSVDKNWFNFGYNQSTLQKEEYYLINATFKLKKVDRNFAEYAKGRRDEIIRHRSKRYPTSNTCGSFFRNFFETEVSLMSGDKKMIYVAYYLDKIGIKGNLQVGNAIVSYQHANMIVNMGNATTSDIISLARSMQKLVFDSFGILPQPECQLIGFKDYPLFSGFGQ